jgi:hypothetical protein
MTWAEDRATQRCDPSAAPGAKIEGRALFFQKDAAHLLLRDWHQSEKPSRPEAVILPTRCRPLLANLKPSRFQFTVNQDKLSRVATLKHEPTVPVNNDKGQGRGGF